MTPDEYLQTILNRETVDTAPNSPVREVQRLLTPILRGWVGNQLLSVTPSGSFAKGTANHSGTDIDLFISLNEQMPHTLKQLYESLASTMQAKGYAPRQQNVSINVTVNGYKVALVPAKRQNPLSADHSLYRQRADTWTKTNVSTHIDTVKRAGRISETRILKLWRDQKKLNFPSFCLELTTIAGLSGAQGTLSQNVWTALEYLRDNFSAARVVDPANTNNIISDDLSDADRTSIKNAAAQALKASNWGEIVV
jgi:hypothetical protein